jgi:histidinol phosphatase-like enzyme (inositol monophosphatase family)
VFLKTELNLARSVAAEAGRLALRFASDGVVTESKLDLSPVTVADRECEKLIVLRIAEAFPADGVLGEEGTERPSGSGRRWIVDPIDGTRDFVRGLPLWSVLIGLEIDGEVALGICYMAATDQMYWAVRGEGAYVNDTRIRASGIDAADQALVCVTALNSCEAMDYGGRLLSWLTRFWAVRSLGGCVDAMMVASGRAEVWIEPHAKAWDLAPLKVILEEAGAIFRNLDGGSSIYGGNCVAYVPKLEPAVRELIAR